MKLSFLLLVPLLGCAESLPQHPDRTAAAPEPVDAQPSAEVESEGDPWLILTDVRFEGSDDDDRWEEGEPATLYATVVNTRRVDHLAYPGVVVETDDDRVAIEAHDHYGGVWFFGVSGRSTIPLALPVDATVPAGEAVTFTMRTTTMGCEHDGSDCLDVPDTAELRVPVR